MIRQQLNSLDDEYKWLTLFSKEFHTHVINRASQADMEGDGLENPKDGEEDGEGDAEGDGED